MKTILTLLAIAALTFTAHAQTNRSLVYNTSNNTVIGPTNTNALTFTNRVRFDDGSGDTFTFNGPNILTSGGLNLSFSASAFSITGALEWGGTNASSNKSTTRSNLFGSVGVSTNIQFVRVGGTTNTLVFSNGLLHSVTTP